MLLNQLLCKHISVLVKFPALGLEICDLAVKVDEFVEFLIFLGDIQIFSIIY
jgi:hypothetical protein